MTSGDNIPETGNPENIARSEDRMKKQIEKLAELSARIDNGERARLSKKAGGRGSRFEKSASLDKWSVSGTRPRSDRGVTFHFQHKFITKGRHVSGSSGGRDQTPAAAHQEYIERGSAVEQVDDGFWERLDLMMEPGTKSRKGPDWTSRAAADENPIFMSPTIYHDPGRISFGTLGPARHERVGFWRSLEDAEGIRGRVQNRIILELPHEIDTRGRIVILRAFCEIFEERGLPYWAVIHAPHGHNDPRNFHAHIAYSDRPARISTQGIWDFDYRRVVRGSNRARRTVRPFMANKNRNAQGREWMIALRRRFADVANFHLALFGAEKRYDPRPYKESGVVKEPTHHLGAKSAVTETYGIATRRGLANVRNEVRFRLSVGDTIFAERDSHRRHIENRLRPIAARMAGTPDIQKIARMMNEHQSLGAEGRDVFRRIEIHKIASEAVSLRMSTRRKFLRKEGDRLFFNPPKGREGESFELATALMAERLLIDRTSEEMNVFVNECRRVAQRETGRLSGIDIRQDQLLRDMLDVEASLMQKSGIPAADVKRNQRAFEIAWRMDRETEAPEKRAVQAPTLVDAVEIRSTDDLAIEKAATQIVGDLGSEKSLQETAMAPARKKDEAVPKAPETAAEDRQENAGAQPEAAPKKPISTDRKQDVIDAFLEEAGFSRHTQATIPGAFMLPLRRSADDIHALEAEIMKMSNVDLRRRTFITRDACDLSENEDMKKRYADALSIAEDIAARRGLDLDTGRHDPEKALDKALARVHTDSDPDLPQHVLTRRKNHGIA